MLRKKKRKKKKQRGINEAVDYYLNVNWNGLRGYSIDRYKSFEVKGQWSIKLIPEA